jgi:hypothetical protein
MFSATECMEREIKGWRATGRPSIIAEFIYRNGRAFDHVRYTPRRGKVHECFLNAMEHAEKHGLAYVEGYGFSGGVYAHHAWCCDGDVAVEPTWRASRGPHVYFGLVFDAKQAMKWMCENGVSRSVPP